MKISEYHPLPLILNLALGPIRPGQEKSDNHANDKDADQPEHPRSLISTFAFRYLEKTVV